MKVASNSQSWRAAVEAPPYEDEAECLPELDGERSDGYTDDEYDDGFTDDAFRDMVSDFLTSFVTNPDLEKGFKFSGKTQSHIQLETVNSSLRRRLAATLVSLERWSTSGGLLANDFVHEYVLDRIHELGQSADSLCCECADAKRGSVDLTQRTEKLQHSVGLLYNWIDWLRHPLVPGHNGRPANMPTAPGAAAPPPAAAKGADAFASHMMLEQLETCMRQVVEEKTAAADRAMQSLLEEEEQEAQRREKLDKKKEGKKQRRKNKKKAAAAATDTNADKQPPATKEAKATVQPEVKPEARPEVKSEALVPQGGKQSKGTKRGGVKQEENDVLSMTDATGAPVRAQRIAGGFGTPGVAPEDTTEICTASAFDALEGLDEDLSSRLLLAPSSRRRPAPESHPLPVSTPTSSARTAAPSNVRSAAPGSTRAVAPSGGRAAAAPAPDGCQAARPQAPMAGVSPSTQVFVAMIKRKDLWDAAKLTGAMNPESRTHDPALRAAYAILNKPDQQMVWQLVPHGGKRKTPAAPTSPSCDAPAAAAHGARGGRGAAAHSAGKAHRGHAPAAGDWSHVPAPFGSEVAGGAAEAQPCVVCLERAQDALLLPCRHTVLCLMCAFQVQDCSGDCPFCRCKIDEVLRLQ